MKITYLRFEDSQLRVANKEVLLTIDNPGAIFTRNRIMVIHPDNKTFGLDDIEKITELLTKDFR